MVELDTSVVAAVPELLEAEVKASDSTRKHRERVIREAAEFLVSGSTASAADVTVRDLLGAGSVAAYARAAQTGTLDYRIVDASLTRESERATDGRITALRWLAKAMHIQGPPQFGYWQRLTPGTPNIADNLQSVARSLEEMGGFEQIRLAAVSAVLYATGASAYGLGKQKVSDLRRFNNEWYLEVGDRRPRPCSWCESHQGVLAARLPEWGDGAVRNWMELRDEVVAASEVSELFISGRADAAASVGVALDARALCRAWTAGLELLCDQVEGLDKVLPSLEVACRSVRTYALLASPDGTSS